MAEYEFTVVLNGSGDTEEAAWADAVEAFTSDPGEPHSTVCLEGQYYVFPLRGGSENTNNPCAYVTCPSFYTDVVEIVRPLVADVCDEIEKWWAGAPDKAGFLEARYLDENEELSLYGPDDPEDEKGPYLVEAPRSVTEDWMGPNLRITRSSITLYWTTDGPEELFCDINIDNPGVALTARPVKTKRGGQSGND